MFKMAPNSLFAILMRSPWWVSLCISLGLGLVSRALLSDEYWLVGAMSGVPFIGIAFLALRRQLRSPSPARVQALLERAGKASWHEFSKALETAYARDGFAVQRTQGAADLILSREGRTTLVATKRWKAARQGTDSFQSLLEAMREQSAERGIYVALGDISDTAQRLATQNNIEILQGAALAQLLRDW